MNESLRWRCAVCLITCRLHRRSIKITDQSSMTPLPHTHTDAVYDVIKPVPQTGASHDAYRRAAPRRAVQVLDTTTARQTACPVTSAVLHGGWRPAPASAAVSMFSPGVLASSTHLICRWTQHCNSTSTNCSASRPRHGVQLQTS